ncbi:hypothetical protein SAMN05216330_11818 [Bradyrhizobium sp. Ghvi]|nr:hypothetical protein SAMN05216330_11818 [Bradyrhizobium sp. Ghvi]
MSLNTTAVRIKVTLKDVKPDAMPCRAAHAAP